MSKVLDFLFPSRKLEAAIEEQQEATKRARCATDSLVKTLEKLGEEMAGQEAKKKEAVG